MRRVQLLQLSPIGLPQVQGAALNKVFTAGGTNGGATGYKSALLLIAFGGRLLFMVFRCSITPFEASASW